MTNRGMTEKIPTRMEAVGEAAGSFAPAVDVYEDAEGFTLMADLAGADPGAIDVRLEGDELSLQAPVPPRQAPETAYLAREYGVGGWTRTFRVGEAVDASRIEAEYADGVLTLRLPKAEAAKPRKIAVRRN